VWIAFAPLWRLVLAFVVGKPTEQSANLLLSRLVHGTDAQVPFFTSDQLAEYRSALLPAYGQWLIPLRRGTRGPQPMRRGVPRPDLLSAQVVKQREHGQVVAVSNKVVFADQDALQRRLATSPASTTINTSFVERENLTLRQQNRRLPRKTNAYSKELAWLENQLWLWLAYYDLVLPHESLRTRLSEPAPTRGTGTARRWQTVTPAMAAGMTDHIWSMTELLSYRVPAAFLDRLRQTEHLFPSLEPIHQGN